jgi:hypothetical protein
MIITLEDAKNLLIKNIDRWLKSSPPVKNSIHKIFIIRDTLGMISFVISCSLEKEKAITQIIQDNWFQYEEYSETESFKEWLGGIFINDDDMFNLFANEIQPSDLTLDNCAENIPWLEETLHLESWRDKTLVKSKTGAKVISFYSYKGGVGRTTLAAILSLHCAKKNKKVVVIDTDVEAPGLGFQFLGKGTKVTYQTSGFLDFILYPYQNLESENQKKFKQTFVSEFFVQNQHDLPNIMLMPVAKLMQEIKNGDNLISDAYSQKISRINVLQGGLEKIHLLLDLINELIKPDLVMFDLRTGITDIGGILTSHSVSDFFVFVGYPDTQTQLGLSFFLKHATQFNLDDEDENRAYFNTIFVHSPAPLDDNKNILPIERDSFKQMINSYVAQFYEQTEEATETLEEFIFTIPYQPNLRSLIRENGIKEAFKEGYFEYIKGYQEIADKILLLNSDENQTSAKEPTISSGRILDYQSIFDEFKNNLETMPLIKGEAADAETDLNNMKDIIVNFQPLRDYQEMLNDRIFLITGEKGAGKSALEQVFDESKSGSTQLVEALVNKLDINWDIKKPTWIPATDKGFVMKLFSQDFKYKKEIHEIFEDYGFWKIYSLGLIDQFLTTRSFQPTYREKVVDEMVSVYQKNPEQLNRMYDEKDIHNRLETQRKKVVLTYDYLDSPEREVPLNSIKQLILLWYRLKLNPDLSYFNAKIFLRDDLLQQIEWSDKGKVRSNHGYEIRWDFYKLMYVFLKRLCARSEAFFERLKDELSKQDILLRKANLGDDKLIIFFPEKPEAVDTAIKLLFGERITQSYSNKFLERYLWNGTTLQNEKQYNARFMLRFMHHALTKCKQPAKGGIFDIYTPLKQEYGKIAKIWVEDEVFEMYQDLKPYISKIKDKATTEPKNFQSGRIKASLLKGYLKLKNEGEAEKIKTMKQLEGIGFIKKKKGDYDDLEKLEFYFPELYRAYLGIKKVNSLPHL